MHVSIHPDRLDVRVTEVDSGTVVLTLTELRVGEHYGDEIDVHRQTAASLIRLGEQIAIEGKKLLDAQAMASIRAQLAEPVPDPFLPVKAWTAEEIVRREA